MEPAPASQERRKSQRREVQWPVRLVCADGVQHEGVCTDIGDSGLGFQTDALLRAGEVVDMEFPSAAADTPSPHPAVRAQIIYRMGDHYGASLI